MEHTAPPSAARTGPEMHAARSAARLTQAELARALTRSRWWLRRRERAEVVSAEDAAAITEAIGALGRHADQ